MRSEQLIVALDLPSDTEAKALVRQLKKEVSIFKVGLQLFTIGGPQIIKAIQKTDHKVFLDLKYHDIPTTVAKAVMEATKLGVFMLTVHALGGKEMLERAVEAAADTAEKLSLVRPRIVAVTVPTSRQDLGDIGIGQGVRETVLRLAELAASSGCDGVVCAPQEVSLLKESLPDLQLVVPGIRLGGDESDDQKRVDTPQSAIAAGADYIVVGRPVLRAADPVVAVQKINASIHGVDPSKVIVPSPAPEEPAAEPRAAEAEPAGGETPPSEAPIEAAPVAETESLLPILEEGGLPAVIPSEEEAEESPKEESSEGDTP